MLFGIWRLAFGLFAGALCAGIGGCAMVPSPRAAVNLVTSAPAPGTERTAYNLRVFDNVWSWIYRGYYDAQFNGVDWFAARERHRAAAARAQNETELYAIINTLLGELKDPHTHAATAEEFASTFTHRNAVVGLRTLPMPNERDGRRRIIEVFPGAPAALAGVRVGWILISCDGRPPGEVLGPGKLRDGQEVKCIFLTTDGEKVVELHAREMVVPPYRSIREVAPDIYVLRFDGFDMLSARWVGEQMRAHRDARGIILDLRGNPGGHIFALGAVIGDFFPHRIATGKLVHRGRPSHWDVFIPQHGAHYRGPLAVLVSHYTTSAAEIFAQLVQDYGRGKIIGETSAGAMLTSVFWPLPAKGKLQLSVYDYRSPKGRRLEGNGVEPDVVVNYPTEPTEDKDPGLEAAVKEVGRGVRE